jgi:hypothetical protein
VLCVVCGRGFMLLAVPTLFSLNTKRVSA